MFLKMRKGMLKVPFYDIYFVVQGGLVMEKI